MRMEVVTAIVSMPERAMTTVMALRPFAMGSLP